MAQKPVQAPNRGILARLSSTITVEEGPAGYIQLWRESARGQDVCISLRPEAQDALLAFLLARKGITLQGQTGLVG